MGSRWNVSLVPGAERELDELSRNPDLLDVWEDALAVLAELTEDHQPAGSIALRDHPGYYRARIAGNYRIIYRVSKNRQHITVTRVRHRRTVYEGL